MGKISLLRLHRNNSLIVIGVVFLTVIVLAIGLGSIFSVRVVVSGSMCIPCGGACDGLAHPFTSTIHKGDLIIIQRVDPKNLNSNYPNSDVIVYHDPTADSTATPIVHRIVTSYTENGLIYFQTKGDGNPYELWPNNVPSTDYDSNTVWHVHTGQGVPGDLVDGKVIMRIPWVGWITLILQANPLLMLVIFAVVIVLLIIMWILPVIQEKQQDKMTNKAFS